MGPPNRLVTPDYPGAMKRVVESAVGGHCLFLQGSAGDQGPVQGFQGDPKIYRQLGTVLGHEVSKIALGLNSIPSGETFREIIPSGAPLGMARRTIRRNPRSLPVRTMSTEIASLPLREGLAGEKYRR